jgi:hypothetical protein
MTTNRDNSKLVGQIGGMKLSTVSTSASSPTSENIIVNTNVTTTSNKPIMRLHKKKGAPISTITALGEFIREIKQQCLKTRKTRQFALSKLKSVQEVTELEKNNLFKYALKMLA